LVERYPNDFAYRYELGALLLAANRLEEAVQQLQYAQRNPKFRQPASSPSAAPSPSEENMTSRSSSSPPPRARCS
jgi:hypothetical protein